LLYQKDVLDVIELIEVAQSILGFITHGVICVAKRFKKARWQEADVRHLLLPLPDC